MPEGSKDAAILIAVSYQALNRALSNNELTRLTDCTVLILFAGFYVEATLNYIFESTGRDIKDFPISFYNRKRKPNPGMRDKLAWFYNEFIEELRAENWEEIGKKNIYDKIDKCFPGFSELCTFRNDISHGRVNDTAKDLQISKKLREQAKDIVNKLYEVLENRGITIKRVETYQEAIGLRDISTKGYTSRSSSDIF